MTDPSASTPQQLKHQPQRRKLCFSSLQDVLADAQELAAGPLDAIGTWSAGQIFLHLARAIDMSIDGAPPRPWVIRLVAQLFLKQKFLTQPMQPGWKLPAQNLLPGETSTEAGLRTLQRAIERLGLTEKREPHPIFGTLNCEQWNQLHCRHAELHLSYLVPVNESDRSS